MPASHRIPRALRWLLLPLAAWLILVALQIDATGKVHHPGPADAAIVLGAAVNDAAPSPVFRERIRHGLTLYRTGRVRKLILTGGYGEGAPHAESQVARAIAIRAGVPAQAILIETRSRTTQQNMAEAKRLMDRHRLSTALIVSDPLHMKRALRMARDTGITAYGAPTPTTRYRSWKSKTGFLLREVYFYNHYLVTGD
ncbi:YdcF family protein [Sphingomonas sp. R647]|uniref:YdcF family protein n=1 Tax=Sphingomonas sp. R647 TaxID=2875233 RepID=UPI001CD49C97|nr:YdcF family protein [Sphingomonas sp. R647]MCA1197523.1 YdcF family protein [Sphingomonas sp. R647]